MAHTAGWYITHLGERLWSATKDEARRLARKIANDTGKPVTVRPAKAPARRMKKNPDPSSYVFAMAEHEKARAARRTYVAATKGKRLAKSMRGRGGAARSAETAARKTAKFSVDAHNRKEKFKLYRPSRSAADQLAREFIAAGYTVTVKEV